MASSQKLNVNSFEFKTTCLRLRVRAKVERDNLHFTSKGLKGFTDGLRKPTKLFRVVLMHRQLWTNYN